jgi:YebC/PmpR family DNA-binding regulatory protein
MAGHSHWAGIKHKKAKEDAKRGKVFSRLAKAIMTAVRHGGKDPDMNLDLRYALDDAKAANMPKDNIERAILKGAGELPGQQVEAVRFEGYGPGGAAVMIDALTDNRNRTTPHVRKILGDHGGELGANGCVAWVFEPKGMIIVPAEGNDEEELFLVAAEAGAEDVEESDDTFEITCDVKDLHTVRKALEDAGVEIESSEMTQLPQNYVDLTVNDARKMIKMLEELEDDEDVTGVYSNFNIPDELMAEMEE